MANKVLPTIASYTTTILLDQPFRSLGSHTVTAAIVFTVDTTGAQEGYVTGVTLIADGSHIPDFSAADGHTAATSNYDNTAAAVNQVFFYYMGARACVSVKPLSGTGGGGGGGGDTTPPTLSSIVIENATPTLMTLTFNEALDASGSTAVTGDFTVLKNGSADSLVGLNVTGSTVELTLAIAAVSTDVYTVAFAGGTDKIQDLAGNDAVSFAATAVTNNVSAGSSAIVFDHMDANLVAVGTNGLKKINTSGWDAFATSSTVFADGDSIICKPTGPSSLVQMFFGLTDTLTPTTTTDLHWGLYLKADPMAQRWNNGTPVDLGAWAINDWYKITRAGTTLEFYKSTDGVTWGSPIGITTGYNPAHNIILVALNTIDTQFENLTRQ